MLNPKDQAMEKFSMETALSPDLSVLAEKFPGHRSIGGALE
jgi:hypothetical protein